MRPSKDEVLAFLKPEPITEEEMAGLEKLKWGTTRFTASG
jgi:hypothetical protein